jgi:hypothetical protein
MRRHSCVCRPLAQWARRCSRLDALPRVRLNNCWVIMARLLARYEAGSQVFYVSKTSRVCDRRHTPYDEPTQFYHWDSTKRATRRSSPPAYWRPSMLATWSNFPTGFSGRPRSSPRPLRQNRIACYQDRPRLRALFLTRFHRRPRRHRPFHPSRLLGSADSRQRFA